MSRENPPLTGDITIDEFRKHDWLKTELMAFCRDHQLSAAGSKEDLAQRIENHLTVGERKVRRRVMSDKVRKTRPKRASQKLDVPTPETMITVDFRGSQNNRRLFREHLGKKFRFTASLTSWMRANVGKTYADAMEEYRRQQKEKRNGEGRAKNGPQAAYNRFLREYRTANPQVTFKEAIAAWHAHKKQVAQAEPA
ncbi:MAG: DUF6434 domain-containing protein [Catalinimonas sp.]